LTNNVKFVEVSIVEKFMIAWYCLDLYILVSI